VACAVRVASLSAGPFCSRFFWPLVRFRCAVRRPFVPPSCSAVLFCRRAGWVFRRWVTTCRRRACSMWLRAACSRSCCLSAEPGVCSSFRSRWSPCAAEFRRVPFRLGCSVRVWLPVVLCARSCSRGVALQCSVRFLSLRPAVGPSAMMMHAMAAFARSAMCGGLCGGPMRGGL
jgi:hypothetical protein